MVRQYIKPLKRPPKNPSSGKGKTVLGLRREAVLNEYAAHAVEEHQWAQKPGADAIGQRACAECAGWVQQLKESEEWV